MECTGGLWAWVGQIPRWVRIFSMTSGCSMSEERDEGRKQNTQIKSGSVGSLAA